MENKPKKCPFCGTQPWTMVMVSGDEHVCCSNDSCFMRISTRSVRIDIWNDRPNEEEIQISDSTIISGPGKL